MTTKLAAIINVTPDSFSDGGKYFDPNQAIEHGIDIVNQGVEVLDIGGESTRPGSDTVDNQDEINRIVPVIKGLREKTDAIISVDTWKAEVATAAIKAGAHIINDITGLLGEPEMIDVIANSDVKVIAMFNPIIARPNHPNTQKFRHFGGDGVFSKEELDEMAEEPIVPVMMKYFDKVIELTEAKGIDQKRLIFDPGIGFALTKKENYELIHGVKEIHKKGYEVFLGVSRKRFVVNTISQLGLPADPETEEGFANRDLGSAIITSFAVTEGVEYVRVHSIAEHQIAIAIMEGLVHPHTVEDESFGQYTKK